MEKLTKSRETLEQIFKITEVDGKFYQDKLRVGLKELKPFVIVKAYKFTYSIPCILYACIWVLTV